jgi:RNA polymerase sigma factor (sigma-70 family)
MSKIGPITTDIPFQTQEVCALEQKLQDARPRLLTITRWYHVPFDAAEDIVQETLLEAWSHLAYLHTPDRFDAWLDGICRNMCRRWIRWHQTVVLRQEPLPRPVLTSEGILDDQAETEMLDPLALDPAEALCQQDLQGLLKRSLLYLPERTRTMVELCYLAEIPQKEVAQHLGIPLGALEERLRRARHHLQQVLCGELRAEAEAFGIGKKQDLSLGWQETPRWCSTCGRYRLRGAFDSLPNGHATFRLRCPACSRHYHVDDMRVEMQQGRSSLRPALKHAEHLLHSHYGEALTHGQQTCPSCKALLPVQILHSDEFSIPIIPDRFYIVLHCSRCGIGHASIALIVMLSYPAVRQFVELHPRCINEPDAAVEYEGQPAFRICLRDFISAARLTIFLHRQTWQVLAIFQEKSV